MDAWQGQPKPGNSDVHNAFANVTACFDELPRVLECTLCERRVIWPKFIQTMLRAQEAHVRA